jgi:2-aminoadipate transaminase
VSGEEQVIYFTRGVPPAEAFPTEQLQECAAAILERQGPVVLQYHPAAGFAPLREWLGQRHGAAPEQVLVSNGSLQLLVFVAELLTSPGDAVLVERPSYDRTITAFRRRGLRILGVPVESDGFDVDAFEGLVKKNNPRLFYIIPDFQNPSGITTSQAKRETLVELAERYDFWVLEDGPYRELRYDGEPLPSIFSLGSRKGLLLSSFSKLLSPGMRVGYLIGPQDLVGKVAKIAEDTYVTPNMLSQGIVYEYCRRGWLEPNIARLKELYRPRLEAVASALETRLPRARWTKPEGGFFVGVCLPSDVDVSVFKTRAHQMGVRLSDGKGFFSDDGGDRFLRLPFCALSPEEIREGVRRLSSIAGEASK